MASGPIKAASDSDVTAHAEETLGIDDDTLRGEEKCLKRLIGWNFTKGSTLQFNVSRLAYAVT